MSEPVVPTGPRPDARGTLIHPQHTDRDLERATDPIDGGPLADYAEWFWSVRWRRHDQPHRSSEVIGRPCCHLSFEAGRTATGEPLVRHGVTLPAAVITTVWTRRFVVALEGEAQVYGLRFRPGALTAITGRSLAADQTLPAEGHLPGAAELLPRVIAEPDDAARRTLVEGWLLTRLPTEVDPDYRRCTELLALMATDPDVSQVEQVADRAGMSVRGVQRLCGHFLGVGPKWLLVRSRLQDAAAALDTDPDTELSDLAHRLGWYDQSHFVRDFRRFLGRTPGQYARDAR